MSATAASLQRFILSAKAAHRAKAEVEALDRYPWPLTLRIAAYITWCGAMLSMAVRAGPNPWKLVIVGVLGVVFLRGLVTLSEKQCLSTQTKRAAVLAGQCAIAVALLALTYCMGSELLLYVVAVELQFVFSFRTALIGTVVLVAVQDVMMLLVGVPTAESGGTLEFLLASPAGFAFVAAFTRSAVVELVQRYRATTLLDELNEAHVQLQAYADQVEGLAVARERNRMAREIHDTLGHYLTVINVQIESAQKLRERDAGRSAEALATAKRLATECLAEVRRSVSALRPAALEDAGLCEAVHGLVEGLGGGSDPSVHLEIEGRGQLSAEVEVTVYRAIQEALTNVRKHAGADNVWLTLRWDDEQLTVEVRDDGRGGDRSSTDGQGVGLRGMQERLERIGGTLAVNGSSDGFSLTIHAPVTRQMEPALP